MLAAVFLLPAFAAAFLIFRHREGKLKERIAVAQYEKKKARDELRATLHSIAEGVITTDLRGLITRLNHVAEEMTGWNENEAVGKPVGEIFRTIDSETKAPLDNPIMKFIEDVTPTGTPGLSLLVSKGGAVYPIAESTSPISDDAGSTTGVEMVFRNRTAELAAEKDLKDSEEKFRMAFNTSSDAININRVDDGTCVSINRGYTHLTGFTEEDVIGRTSIEIGIWDNPVDRDRLTAGLRKRGEVQNLEAAFRTKDGQLIYGLMSGSYYRDRRHPLYDYRHERHHGA